MNENKYVDKKIDDIEYSKSKITEKMIFHTLITIVLTIALATPGVLLAKYITECGFIFGLLSAAVPIIGMEDFVSKKASLDLLNTEKKHLENIKEKGIKTSKKLDQKRLERIAELEEQQEKLAEHDIVKDIITIIGSLSWLVGAFGSLLIVSYPLIPLLSIAGILELAFVAAFNVKPTKDFAALQARIDNLRNDIELGSIHGYTPNSKKKRVHTIDSKDNPLEKAKALGFELDENQQKIEDDYIRELTSGVVEIEEGSKIFQKVRK